MRQIAVDAAAAVLTAIALVATGCSGADPEEPGGRANPTSAAPDDDGTDSTADADEPDGADDTDDDDDDDDENSEPDEPGEPRVPEVAGTVTDDLITPWGLTFLPDGTALVSERDTGSIKRIDENGETEVVGEVPGVVPSSEGGLLGLAYHEENAEVYAYFTGADDNRVVRMGYQPGGTGLGRPEVVIDGIPQAAFHDGGRLTFGPDGFLYVATGDGTRPQYAQQMDSLGGKILRLTPDGDPAPGNPFGDDSPVWSFGHRNVQGLTFDDDGRLWASEFGQDSWDELNLIEPGTNYGWPEVEGFGDDEQAEEYQDPVYAWRPADASPSGLTYAEGSLWMAALRGTRLWRIDLRGDRLVGEPTAFFEGDHGRLRTVVAAPDGSLWLTTSNTDGPNRPNSQLTDRDEILQVTLE